MAREFLKKEEIDPDEATEEQWSEAFARAKRIVEEEHKEVVRYWWAPHSGHRAPRITTNR